MKKLTFIVIILGMMTGLAGRGYGVEAPDIQAKSSSISSKTVADLEAQGDLLRGQKDYRQAILYFRVALKKDPNNSVLFNKLGLCELQLNQYGDARKDFERSAKKNPQYPEAFNNMGAIDYLQKRYSSAARNFKKAVALDEGRAPFHVNLGATWFAQNKLERAINEYSRALEIDPEVLARMSHTGISAQINPEERAKYSFMVAKIYAKRGDINGCLEFLRKAKEQGYTEMKNVYREEEFSALWQDARLFEIVPAPSK